MIYRNATVEDIPQIQALQKTYHISSIREEDKKNGFVTTLFTAEQMQELIEQENGISITCDSDRVVAYAMAGSWSFWSKWPLFEYMISDLGNIRYAGRTLDTENSYQYGPVCIDADYRGKGILESIFRFSARQMRLRYPVLITFINQINTRSFAAHTGKVGLDVIKTFSFHENQYYELGYETAKAAQNENQTA
ncbi:MAG: GNAT family acetyltransferase [Eubacteriales bacterium]|nr:GNAT family acetyltransferase [Eubacteriales bacterium]